MTKELDELTKGLLTFFNTKGLHIMGFDNYGKGAHCSFVDKIALEKSAQELSLFISNQFEIMLKEKIEERIKENMKKKNPKIIFPH